MKSLGEIWGFSFGGNEMSDYLTGFPKDVCMVFNKTSENPKEFRMMIFATSKEDLARKTSWIWNNLGELL